MASTARLSQPVGRTRASFNWIVLAVFVLVALVTRATWFGDPVADFDEQIYSLIGWRMTQGDVPFVDLWDRKPFGLFLIFAASHAIFGPGPIAYQAVALMFGLGGAWLVYLLSLRLVDRVSATVAGSLYLMLLAAYGSYSGQTEVFHAPLMLLTAWLVIDWRRDDAVRRALLAMLVAGATLQVKYTVLPQCAFFGTYALYGRWRMQASFREIAALAAAFALLGILPTALVAAWFAAQGQFDAFWFANFISFFSREPSEFGRFWPGHIKGALPIATIATVGIYSALRLNPPRDRRVYAFFLGWALAAFASVILPSTIYLYYYGALAAPAVLVALPLIDRSSPAKWFPAALLMVSLLVIINPPERYSHATSERLAEKRLSDAIRPFVSSGRECLYIFDGPTALYRTTESCLPTRFIYPDHLNNALERNALGVSQVAEVRRILLTRPAVIVTASHPVTPQCQECLALVRNTARASYRPLITITQYDRTITAWVRRDINPTANAL